MTAVKGLLLDPAVVEEAVRENQALTGERRRSALVQRQSLEKELAEVKRRAMRLVYQVADGELSGAAVKDRLVQLERRRTELEAQLQEGADEEGVVALHLPPPARYRLSIQRLALVVAQPEMLELVVILPRFGGHPC